MTTAYRLQLAPFGPPTVWSFDEGVLIQEHGRRRSVFPLAEAASLTIVKARGGAGRTALVLRLGRRQVLIPARGLGRDLFRPAPADDAAPFLAFARALALQTAKAAPLARFRLADPSDRRGPLVWAIFLLAAGAVLMLMTTVSSVVGGLGLSLAAWLAFAALLLAGVLPWIPPKTATFDPACLSAALLLP